VGQEVKSLEAAVVLMKWHMYFVGAPWTEVRLKAEGGWYELVLSPREMYYVAY
jgi:hypothetical protein